MARMRKATGMSTLRERVSFPMDCSAFLSERHGRWRRQNRPYGQQAEACASMSAPACAACGDKEDGSFVQSLFGDEGPAGNPRIGGRHARPDRQSATAVRDLPGLLRSDCPKPTRGSRADDGAVGMPSPVFALRGKKSDPGVTNVRNVKSPRCRRWLGIENRCVVPWTSFSENE